MLKLSHISKTFNPGTVNEKVAIRDLSLHLEKGDFATIIGSNGAGITFLPQHARAKNIGRLYQDPMRGTAPGMTILENLALAAGQGGWLSRISKSDKQRFREQLALLDIGLEDRMNHPVGLLSGGQRQALTLLMATMNPPKLLLLGNRILMMDSGDIVLDIKEEEKKGLTVEGLLDKFKVGAGKKLDNDRILLSNE